MTDVAAQGKAVTAHAASLFFLRRSSQQTSGNVLRQQVVRLTTDSLMAGLGKEASHDSGLSA
jgi:hypothetical protein